MEKDANIRINAYSPLIFTCKSFLKMLLNFKHTSMNRNNWPNPYPNRYIPRRRKILLWLLHLAFVRFKSKVWEMESEFCTNQHILQLTSKLLLRVRRTIHIVGEFHCIVRHNINVYYNGYNELVSKMTSLSLSLSLSIDSNCTLLISVFLCFFECCYSLCRRW